MTLVDEAKKIINSQAQTEDDIIELSKIVFMMSSLYRDALNLATKQEELYNKCRSDETDNAMKQGKKITEAAEIGKRIAESTYGDYRSMQSDCKGMIQIMNSIREFKIAWYVNNKGTSEFISNNKNLKDE